MQLNRWFTLVLAFNLLTAGAVAADDENSSADAVSVTLELAETILNNHVLPPTRQEMLVAAVRAAYREAGLSQSLDLSRRISDAVSTDAARQIMEEQLDPLILQRLISRERLRERLRDGMFSVVAGEVRLVPAESERVAEQFRSNRYVGTGIQLSMQDGVPTMVQVFPDGPAHSVGALDGDFIEVIGGESTSGMSLERVVELLRGPEGTDVTVALRQPDEQEQRVLTITRGVVPLKTISGYEIFPARDGVVACVTIERLTASCVHELEQLRVKLERDGAHGLILDLRFTHPGTVHHAVLLADALLDGEDIGRVRTRAGDRNHVSEPGELFPGLKIGLLVSGRTSGTVEWIVAALQDSERAVIFGERTVGQALTGEAIRTSNDDRLLVLPTALLERTGGRNLLRNMDAQPQGASIPPTMFFGENNIQRPTQVDWGVYPDVSLTAQEPMDSRETAAYQLLSAMPGGSPTSPVFGIEFEPIDSVSEESPSDE